MTIRSIPKRLHAALSTTAFLVSLLAIGCTGLTSSTGQATDESQPARLGATATRCTAPLPEVAGTIPPAAAECPTDPIFGGHNYSRATVEFLDAPKRPVIEVELALNPRERARGLMYRTHLPEMSGMLFFPQSPPHIQSFWMRNTCVPLDMLFINADGYIAGIVENVPTLNDTSRSVPCPTSYVLEVNAGWSRKHGVQPGGRVKLPSKP